MSEKLEIVKKRLVIDGVDYFPALKKLLSKENKAYYEKIKTKYDATITEYIKTISVGGSDYEESKPIVAIGTDAKKSKMFLAYFLARCAEYQGKLYTVDDLSLIRNKDDDESRADFLDYSGLAVLYIHASINNQSDNMSAWRFNSAKERIVTRLRSRRPLVIVSELSIYEWFGNNELFSIINLSNVNNNNSSYTQIKQATVETKETSTNVSRNINNTGMGGACLD